MSIPEEKVEGKLPPNEVYAPSNFVVPLFGLGWAGKPYEILPEVRLVPANEDTLELFGETWNDQSSASELGGLSYIGCGGGLGDRVGAFLVTPDFADAQHLDPKGHWLSSEFELPPTQKDEFIETPGVMVRALVSACENLIITATSLAYQADVRVPLLFKATLDRDATPVMYQNIVLLDESTTLDDYDWRPGVAVDEEDDVETGKEMEAIVAGLNKLWALRTWLHGVQQESFLRELEKSGKDREGIHQAFWKRHAEQFHDATRLGRAVGLYKLGIQTQHPVHKFLSMCLALETLYTDREAGDGISYKLAVRLAHVIGGDDPENRKSYFSRAKRVYNLRSRIVHGTGKKNEKDAEARADAFALAQESLCSILKDDGLIELRINNGKSHSHLL